VPTHRLAPAACLSTGRDHSAGGSPQCLESGSGAPHWVFVNRGNGQEWHRIFDGDTGKMKGMVNMYGQDSFAFESPGQEISTSPRPSGRSWIAATRQDMLLAYDVRTLKLTAETQFPAVC